MTCFRFTLSCFILLVAFLVESSDALANQRHPHHGPASAGSPSSSSDGNDATVAPILFGVYSSGESALFGGAHGSYPMGQSSNQQSGGTDEAAALLTNHLQHEDNKDQTDGRFNAYGK